jgi:hypothetical protein
VWHRHTELEKKKHTQAAASSKKQKRTSSNNKQPENPGKPSFSKQKKRRETATISRGKRRERGERGDSGRRKIEFGLGVWCMMTRGSYYEGVFLSNQKRRANKKTHDAMLGIVSHLFPEDSLSSLAQQKKEKKQKKETEKGKWRKRGKEERGPSLFFSLIVFFPSGGDGWWKCTSTVCMAEEQVF